MQCFVGLAMKAQNPVKYPCFLLRLHCHLQRIRIQCKLQIHRWSQANVHLRLPCQGQLNRQFVDFWILHVYLYRWFPNLGWVYQMYSLPCCYHRPSSRNLPIPKWFRQ